MKKLGILLLALSSMMAFTACGSNEAPAAVSVEAQEAAFTGEKVGEVDSEKGTTIATVTFEEGKPVSVKFDYISKEDGSSKYEQAAAGEYVMKDENAPWNEQVDTLAAFLAENEFDLEKVNLIDEEGHTDAVTGVSIKVPALLDAVKAALEA